MSAIVSASEYAAELHANVVSFFSDLTHVKCEFTLEAAFEIIHAMIDDAVSSQLRWCRQTHYLDKELEKHFPWFKLLRYTRAHDGSVEAISDELSEKFYIDVLDRTECRVSEMVYLAIPDRTWDVWSVRKHGEDIMLVRGPDYRIMDWERRVSSGEWKHVKK